ncbi:MAG TPA: hypothetical protein VHO90_15100, partial [Bacteroidales bacterium]|nr:hypothetical protein [Bacteroidales bacterium]
MIKKLLVITLIVSLFSCEKTPEITTSQDDFHLKVFGGSATDCCYALSAAGEGFCLTGSIEHSNGQDLFLIMTDKYGNELDWSPKLFGTSGVEVGYDISVDKAQNFVMAGYTQPSGTAATDVFVVKTNSQGEELWSKRFGGSGNEVAYALNT